MLRIYECDSGFSGPDEIILNRDETIVGRELNSLNSKEIICVQLSLKKDNKQIISRKHARIIRSISESNTDHKYKFVIADLGSVNGLYVNGIRVNVQQLLHKDIIQIGGGGNVAHGAAINRSDANVKYIFLQDIQSQFDAPNLRLRSDSSKSSSTSNLDKHLQKHQPIDATSAANKRIRTGSDNTLSTPPDFAPQPSSFSSELWPTTSLNSNVQKQYKLSSKQSSSHSNKPMTCSGSLSSLPPSGLMTEQQLLTQHVQLHAFQQEELRKEIAALQRKMAVSQQEHKVCVEQITSKLKEATSKLESLNNLNKELKKHNMSVLSTSESLFTENQKLKNSLDKALISISDKDKLIQSIYSGPKMKGLSPLPLACNDLNTGFESVTEKSLDVSSFVASVVCSLCSEILIESVLLPCSHSFCRACVEKEWADRPKCRGLCAVCHDFKFTGTVHFDLVFP